MHLMQHNLLQAKCRMITSQKTNHLFMLTKSFGIRGNKILLEYLVKSKSKFTESHSGSFEVIPGH